MRRVVPPELDQPGADVDVGVGERRPVAGDALRHAVQVGAGTDHADAAMTVVQEVFGGGAVATEIVREQHVCLNIAGWAIDEDAWHAGRLLGLDKGVVAADGHDQHAVDAARRQRQHGDLVDGRCTPR